MGPLHAAADNRHGLCAATALASRTDGIGALDRIDAQLAERAIEETVIRAAAEFSPLAKRARSRINSAGRSKLPICSARNGGFDPTVVACARTFTMGRSQD
jgi:hypothetical protein